MRTCEREGLYFHPRKFVENNIKYRISSGASIAKFKHSQAFLLTELSFNPYHVFSKVAKETLLLKYDVWFDFICEVEQYLLVQPGEIVTKDYICDIFKMSSERVDYYHSVMEENDYVFEQKYTSIWKEVHEMVYELLLKEIAELEGLNLSEFFDGMCEKLINTMNHTLYELHECDILIYSDGDLEFNLDSLCCDYYDEFGESLILSKYDLFMEIRPTKNIIIKQYSDVGIPFSITPVKKELERRKIQYKVI